MDEHAPTHRRSRSTLVRAVGAGALVAAGLLVAPPALATPAGDQAVSPSTADRTALTQAYAAGRDVGPSAVAGIRSGSLHEATDASGNDWAIAMFSPSSSANAAEQRDFQGGGDAALFTRAAGSGWKLADVLGQPYLCSTDIPAAALSAWNLSRPASCSQSEGSQKKAASAARTALTDASSSTASSGAASSETLGQRIADIALSEVGVGITPASDSIGVLDCDPFSTLDGPATPNADGCGVDPSFGVVDENEEWCADFTKWVWEQAGVTADTPTLNAGANSFYAWGTDQGETLTPDAGTPQVGDAIVFYAPGAITTATGASHVGIVVAVHPDGTIDMVNGDFSGAPDVGVKYDTDVDLSTWAPAVWGSGEQWVDVSPNPAGVTTPAVPTGRITGFANAVAGTPASFSATGTAPGGKVTGYQWTFGDGVTATGAKATHVFPNAGEYTVTLTVTSSLGSSKTITKNVDVAGTSSAVASTARYDNWYAALPVVQNVFLPSADGGLTDEASDSQNWINEPIAGTPGVGGATATLTYPSAGPAFTPQVFFRGTDGTLAQTSGGEGNWTTGELVGSPSASSDIVATTVPDSTAARGASPEVFYFDRSGHLNETTRTGSSWSTAALPGVATKRQGALAVADTVVGGTPQTDLFYANNDNHTLTLTSSAAKGWRTATIVSPHGIAAGSPITALAPETAGAQPTAYFIDGRGKLAEASATHGTGHWAVTELPSTAAASAGLTSANYQLASGQTVPQLFFADAKGNVSVDTEANGRWTRSALPGTATKLLGVGAYPTAGGAEQLFSTDGSAISEDATDAAGDAWTTSALPNTPITDSGRILLYAADDADYATALQAAQAVGLPASQVKRSFAAAWAATLTGNFTVYAVGVPAVTALYSNTCGWANPSGEDAGGTPFGYWVPPYTGPAGADLFVDAATTDPTQQLEAATDAVYYALHGTWPDGFTALPTLAGSNHVCAGSAS